MGLGGEDEGDGEGSNGYTGKEGTTIVHAGRRLEAEKGETLWNKDGMQFFCKAEKT